MYVNRYARRRAASLASSLALLHLFLARSSSGQACCAGNFALTPARLATHERALLGAQLRGSTLIGSFDPTGRYHPPLEGAREETVEQNLFAALRFLPRAEGALVLPWIETHRRAPGPLGSHSEWGGGVGDLNVSVRYDLLWTGERVYVPGVSIFAGATLPTGRSPESAHGELATDATGIGVAQGHLGVGFEHHAGHWLGSLSLLAAQRAPRHIAGIESRLATQYSALLGVSYVFEVESALGTALDLTWEGNAHTDGREQAASGRRRVSASVFGALPLDDRWRLQAQLTAVPPVLGWGKNEPATLGASATLVRSWM